MSKHRKREASSKSPKAPASKKTAPLESHRVAGWRLWVFRLLALVAAPALFFIFTELVLRLAGFGHPTEFLLPSLQNGQKTFVQNNQFGWRFFGPKLLRLPWPISISQSKSSNTTRIFVFGESAAKGEPQPTFGLPRMLEAMLSFKYPNVRFEVVNAAMTAINSHAVLPIARDCVKAEGDIWVVYMGNNEVVGPFGAGTVFGSQVPPLPVIRGLLALKATRTGQLLDLIHQRIQRPQQESDEWGGMKMFMDHQVAADDPRLEIVYQHFAQNLADLIRAGQHNGVGMVVSTVAVNLKDSAPFASMHRTGLSGRDKQKWEMLYQLGIKAQTAGNEREAMERFQTAAQIDDRFADLRFRQGECLLALGQIQPAREHFKAARNLDTLRFRCDTHLNDLIRQETSQRESERILFTDAEQVFAQRSPDGLPGENLFYEHVHLNFSGNYLLARALCGQIDKLLPERIKKNNGTNQTWPSAPDCAKRLGWSDLNQWDVINDILTRINAAPFTGQLNHEAQVLRLEASLKKLAPAVQPAGLKQAQSDCEGEVNLFPDDPTLSVLLASVKSRNGDLAGAATALRQELTLLPSDPAHWLQLGIILAQQQQYHDAVDAFQRACKLDPGNVMAINNLAQSLWMLGRRDEAICEFRLMTDMKPESSMAWISLGQSLEKKGQKAEADDCYKKALATRNHDRMELLALARFCQTRGWIEAAVTNYYAVIKLNPNDEELRVETGLIFLNLGRYADATQQLGEAVRLAPGSAEAHYAYGLAVGQTGNTLAAEEQFRAALHLQPDRIETRVNLGVALMNEGNADEALAQFEQVLQQCPTNDQALEYSRTLRNQLVPLPAR